MSNLYTDDQSGGMCSYDPANDTSNSNNMSSYDSNPYSNNSSDMSSNNDNIFYSDPSTENMSTIDGHHSSSSRKSSDLCSMYDYGECSSDQNNSSMSSSSSSTNPYAGFYSNESTMSSGAMSYDPGMCSISDIPIFPNVVLSSTDEDHTSADIPIIDAVAIGSDAVQNQERVIISNGKNGSLHWVSKNATHVQINGQQVNLNGKLEIPYSERDANSDAPYEIVAWKNKPENSAIRLLYAFMEPQSTIDSVIGYIGKTVDYNQKLKIPAGSTTYRYFKTTNEIEIEFAGKFTFKKDSASVNTGWDNDGIALQISKQLKADIFLTTIQCDLKGKFKVPVDVTGENEKAKETVAEIGVSSDIYAVFKTSENVEFNIGGKIGLNAVKVAKKTQINADKATINSIWEYKFGELELALFGTAKLSIKTDTGVFAGSVKGTGKIKIEPNWPVIIEECMAQFGKGLGIEAGASAVIAGAAVVATSPVTIAAGALATIVFGCIKIAEAGEAAQYRTKVIPGLVASLTKGINDGLRGNGNAMQKTVVDTASAYTAGVHAGMQKRLELANNNEDFDKKSESEKQEIARLVSAQAEARLQIDIFTTMAGTIRGRTFSSGHDKMTSLVSAWNNTIGNAPMSKGGSYVQIWYSNRIQDPDLKYYNGSW
jgi:hypothetical protein